MEFINKKKLPAKALSVLLYICLSFSCWYYMRQLMTYFSAVYFESSVAMLLGNAVIGGLIGGLVLYTVINSIISRTMHPYKLSGVNNDMLIYVFKLAFAVGGLVYGGLSFIYFATPLIAMYGDYILRFIVMTTFVSLAFAYAARNGFIRKELLGRTLYAVFFAYLIAYAAIVSLKLMLYYMMGVS